MQISCAYYRNKLDGSLWAIRADGYQILEAIGPLNPSEVHTPPMERKSAIRTDVTGWHIGAFECVSEVWTMHRKTRIAPGLSHPVGKNKLIQTDTGFSTRLVNV